jgi:pyridoxal phosphate enzyme (YggS family)
MNKDQSLTTRLEAVRERIKRTASACGRKPSSIRLVAVSKTKSAGLVREAIGAGVMDLGENYIQEARDKIAELSEYPVRWHFIGHLQSNKAKYAARLFELIHSVDSMKVALELDRQAQKVPKVQSILIQINLAGESSKSGISPQDAMPLVKEIAKLENLSVRGLMALPPFFNAPEKVRPYFVALRELRDRIRAEGIERVDMDELSMGMTGDFEVAIEEGATLVRIGTAIFGERS